MCVYNVKRFVPSEYGNEVDRVKGALPPFEALLENKRKIRRATEAAGIPYTYVSANSFGAYFVDYLLHPREQCDHVVVHGTGDARGTDRFRYLLYIYRRYMHSRERDFVLIFFIMCMSHSYCNLHRLHVRAAVLNYEEDVAFYTVKAATDPRVANRVIICRPPGNIVSQLDLISIWEKKTGRTLKKIHVPEEDMVKLTQSKI